MTEGQNPKTKTLGTIDTAKVKKIPGWTEYDKAAKALGEARKAVQSAKLKVKEHIKKALKEDGEIDFTVETTGNVRVFKNLVQKQVRRQEPDLSEAF